MKAYFLLIHQSEARQKYPKEWLAHINDSDFVIPQGESYDFFVERTTKAMKDILFQHQVRNIIT